MNCEVTLGNVPPSAPFPPIIATIMTHVRMTMLCAAADPRVPIRQVLFTVRHNTLFPEGLPLFCSTTKDTPDPAAALTAQVGLSFQLRPLFDPSAAFYATLIVMY